MEKHYPQIMGVVNVTPDSFSDGGQHDTVDKAVAGALKMINEGVHWLDIGGESTRPGAAPVPVQQELDRVIPVIEKLRNETQIPISIDTSKAKVMTEAVNAGANMINDVCALQQENALDAALKCKVPVCLMHMQGTPSTMQQAPSYGDVVTDVLNFLHARIATCVERGFKASDILVDPGFGFGKTVEQNYQLLRYLHKFIETGHKVLVGLSRKSMIGHVTNRDVDKRLAGSLAAATLAMHTGAHIIRVHDVAQTIDVMKVVNAYKDV